MTFLNPEYFWLFLFLIAGFIKKDFKELRITSFGYILTLVFIILALTRPVIEQEPIQSEQILSDVVIAVDLSYSMQARDIKPTRLHKAKEILNTLVKVQYKSRFGVLGFTTNAIILSPMTQDSELLKHLFNSLDDKLIITKGSSIIEALKLSTKMSESKHLSLVILSDGTDATSFEDEVRFVKENFMVVNIFMLATKQGSTLSLANGELLKDENSDIVVSRENTNIKVLSSATGGVYTKDLGELLDALNEQKTQDEKSKTIIIKNFELFYYLIVLAIITFLLSVTSLKKYLLAFFLLFGVSLDANVLDMFKDKNILEFKQASSYYKEGKYEKAFESYKTVKSSDAEFKSIVYYNTANSLVRLKKFKEAREAYKKSLTLFYSKEAYENLLYIIDVKEQKQMNTGQQKSSKKSSIAKKKKSNKKTKEGGSSNMKVSASANSGANDKGKKTSTEVNINLNASKAKLSSKQYELINKRGVDEKQPW
ncbi:VWA domain-containing protein [Sulfurimonas sp.]|uniref:VWA domain-containing protein n=1 Tax=Sulfurimonas sp. TaxID=2022749 RepID=UPI002AB212BE|nr:VWA domain-containing protein [Sulfurimonas sp.]